MTLFGRWKSKNFFNLTLCFKHNQRKRGVKMPNKILVCEVAKLLGKSNLFVYEAMKRGFLNIGIAMHMPDSTKWTFSISPTLLAEYLGIDIPTLYERLAEIRS